MSITAQRLRPALNDLLWLLVPLLLVVALARWGRGLSDVGAIAALLLIASVSASGLCLRALIRRRSFLSCCLRPQSSWRRRLRGGVLLWLGAYARALPLALVLVVALARSDDGRLATIFVLNAPLLVLLWHFCSACLSAHVLPRYLPDVGWRVTLASNFALLFGLMSILALTTLYPDFKGLGLREAVLSQVGRESADGPLLLALMQLAAAKDAVAWWFGQQFLPGLAQPAFELAAWLVLLATEALVIWSYLLFCSSALTLAHWRAWYPHMENE